MFGKVLCLALFLGTVRISRPEEEDILRRPDLTLSGFQTFLQYEGVAYPASQMKLRYKLYQRSAAEVALHNTVAGRAWDMGVNQFSTMSEDEKKQWLGVSVNMTLLEQEAEGGMVSLSNSVSLPASVDHVQTGIIPPVKNQGGCGSCWAFAATAAFEGMYAARTWKLKRFSDQEILDCAYADTRDGCGGGWMSAGYDYVIKSNHYSLETTLPYTAKDNTCDHAGKANGMHAVTVPSWTRVRSGDDYLAQAIYTAVPAVAITIENDFYSYRSGIYTGCPTVKGVHHAVTAVGYDANSWKIKNSWGAGWGDGGYIRMSRERPSICRVADYAMFPVVDFTAGVVTIRNHLTGRYLSTGPSSAVDVRDNRGHADGWSYGNKWLYATDANYYNDALWKMVSLGGGKYFIEHLHTGRWVHSDGGNVRSSRGAEGGWTHSPHCRATDHNYYNKAIWRVSTINGNTYIEHDDTGRYLFAAGSNIWNKSPSGGYGGEKIVGADGNYYNYALWQIKPLAKEDMNRLIASEL